MVLRNRTCLEGPSCSLGWPGRLAGVAEEGRGCGGWPRRWPVLPWLARSAAAAGAWLWRVVPPVTRAAGPRQPPVSGDRRRLRVGRSFGQRRRHAGGLPGPPGTTRPAGPGPSSPRSGQARSCSPTMSPTPRSEPRTASARRGSRRPDSIETCPALDDGGPTRIFMSTAYKTRLAGGEEKGDRCGQTSRPSQLRW